MPGPYPRMSYYFAVEKSVGQHRRQGEMSPLENVIVGAGRAAIKLHDPGPPVSTVDTNAGGPTIDVVPHEVAYH